MVVVLDCVWRSGDSSQHCCSGYGLAMYVVDGLRRWWWWCRLVIVRHPRHALLTQLIGLFQGLLQCFGCVIDIATPLRVQAVPEFVSKMSCGSLHGVRDGSLEGVLNRRGQVSIARVSGTHVFLVTLTVSVRDAHVRRVRDLPLIG